ncbi:MAG: RimK/LysX family protein [Spongiibacteraceae bacterium]|nr:RimK/LysX family protein [Spongiibacteraceae bacterium]
MATPKQRIIVGWREWLALPGLGLAALKAKVDTGAKTCALHAFYIERFRHRQRDRVRFGIHPLQADTRVVRHCEAALVDQRAVTDSGGHRELRYVIETTLVLGGISFPAELTLTDRETMRFRMLLGRNALAGRFIVDPGRSYCLGRNTPRKENPR